MLATRVLKPRSLTAANSASSSRCIDCMRSLTLLRRTAQALFLALRASRSASFSSPVLAVASSSDMSSSSTMGKLPSSSPSSAISTWSEMSSLELASTSSRCATSRSSSSSRLENFMPIQCTKWPSRVVVIIRPLSPKQLAAPQRAVASGFPIRSKESMSFSNAERDSELLAS
jgi:hypothetical protein